MNNIKTSHSQTYPSGLYIVSTPIGNLRDISLRALDVLQIADVILCEDTRVSGRLMAHYGIKSPLLSYHDHNGEERRPKILSLLSEGKILALISDAGTPLISDPGYKLVKEVEKQGYYISVIPGSSSVLAALCISGMPSDNFYFAGFLPTKAKQLADKIASLANINSTLIIFESAKRLDKSLNIMLDIFGDREVAIVREITKIHEESRKNLLSKHINYYQQKGLPKGEIVIVVAPPPQNEQSQSDLRTIIATLMQDHSLKDAATIAAEQTRISRKEAYEIALSLK